MFTFTSPTVPACQVTNSLVLDLIAYAKPSWRLRTSSPLDATLYSISRPCQPKHSIEIFRQLTESKAKTYMPMDKHYLTGSSNPTITFFRFHA